MISKLYTIISNKLWDLSLYFGDRYNTWVLASQQNALGPCKCARFRAKQTYNGNYSFSCLLTFVSVYKSFSRKKHFLKNSWFFSFKLFQSHNWLTNYPDSDFHGHWKTVTLSSISPNLSTEIVLWELSIVSSLSLYSILVQHAFNDRQQIAKTIISICLLCSKSRAFTRP